MNKDDIKGYLIIAAWLLFWLLFWIFFFRWQAS